ncbi:MAG TPA: hypothetical protein VK422_00790 [Pyrinomonadaceae bacterium]|nr:hypothetical protein [Pyrinomonadaceae bacterium]
MKTLTTRALFCLLTPALGLALAAAARTPADAPPPPAAQQQGQPFDPGCTLPFDAIKTTGLGIDAQCPKGGHSALLGASQPHVLQNLAKNNFCVKGEATPVGYDAFVALQTAVGDMGSNLVWGSGQKLPADRTPLQNLSVKDGGKTLTIGEGSKVSFVGYVMAYEFADTHGGEDVNCNLSGDDTNDIHLTLRTTPGLILKRPAGLPDPRCNSVSAEVSPHFRPAAWNRLAAASSNSIFTSRPLRVTGALTFDAEHKPCTDGKPATGSPVRISVWEIHPVYAVDVCKYTTLARCKATDDTAWTPFDQYKAK